MSEAKPFASLGASLLARKGAARPAMRPQLAAVASAQMLAAAEDDLGWNDMGHEGEQAFIPAAFEAPAAAEVPAVVRQQQDLARRITGPRRSALADGRRCAFTLRVDAERHLRLRLACTLKGRSAQQLVTEALDHLLADLPEVAQLAQQVARKAAK